MLIDVGNLFPQTQAMTGDYTRNVLSRETANRRTDIANRWFSQWDYGFNLSWELDFWGRFRRTVEADRATLDASVENYDDVLVTLLGDVATNYTNTAPPRSASSMPARTWLCSGKRWKSPKASSRPAWSGNST